MCVCLSVGTSAAYKHPLGFICKANCIVQFYLFIMMMNEWMKIGIFFRSVISMTKKKLSIKLEQFTWILLYLWILYVVGNHKMEIFFSYQVTTKKIRKSIILNQFISSIYYNWFHCDNNNHNHFDDWNSWIFTW